MRKSIKYPHGKLVYSPVSKMVKNSFKSEYAREKMRSRRKSGTIFKIDTNLKKNELEIPTIGQVDLKLLVTSEVMRSINYEIA